MIPGTSVVQTSLVNAASAPVLFDLDQQAKQLFKIDDHGLVTLAGPLDRELVPSYLVNITARYMTQPIETANVCQLKGENYYFLVISIRKKTQRKITIVFFINVITSII